MVARPRWCPCTVVRQRISDTVAERNVISQSLRDQWQHAFDEFNNEYHIGRI